MVCSVLIINVNVPSDFFNLFTVYDQMSPFLHFRAVYGMPLSEGFIRRKGIDALRVNHEAENCYKTFKIGRNSVICRPKENKFDG